MSDEQARHSLEKMQHLVPMPPRLFLKSQATIDCSAAPVDSRPLNETPEAAPRPCTNGTGNGGTNGTGNGGATVGSPAAPLTVTIASGCMASGLWCQTVR